MKNTLFGMILFLFVYAAVEALAVVGHLVQFGGYSLYQIQHSKLNAIKAVRQAGVYTGEDPKEVDTYVKAIIHPYMGYVVEGQHRLPDCETSETQSCFERIKTHTDFKLLKRAPNRVIVAVLGGSFADGIARASKNTIIRLLTRSDAYKGYEIVVYNLANGAYKQPQQLMHLAYFYSMGAEFDLVLNIDGFNEISGTYYNYRDRGIHPAFPASWRSRVSKTVSNEYLDLYASKQTLLKSREGWAKLLLTEGVRYSPILNFFWRLKNTRTLNKIAKLDQAVISLKNTKSSGDDYQGSGPDYEFNDWDGFFDYASQLWANSSIALNALAEGQGAQYYHFLQPNQYIEGNKILSKWEAENAVLIKGGYGNVYKKYRQALIAQVDSMRKSKVNFTDLSFSFADRADTIYIDNCCHMNDKGYDWVVTEAISTILEDQTDSK